MTRSRPLSSPHVIVIGAGSIGRRHHDNLQALGANSRLLSWREHGLSGVERAISQADAVVIATATDIRQPLIARCADAGLPVYVEKPLAFEPAEVSQLLQIAAPVADRSMLGFMMRYHPAFRALHDTDRSSTYRIDLSIGHDVTQWRQDWRFSQSYAARAEGGGVLLDLCHEIDMAVCLFPKLQVADVLCLGHTAYPGVDMASTLFLSGPDGTLSMDYLAPQLHRRTRLFGTGILADFDFASETYFLNGTRQDHPLARNAMFLDAMGDFLALVAGRTVTNPIAPRLDLIGPSAAMVARAWAMRRFTGVVAKELP